MKDTEKLNMILFLIVVLVGYFFYQSALVTVQESEDY